MRLAYVDLCGFRGYRKRTRIEFANRVTIIDGRNGVGKSTIFDAVEFALTGALSKYKETKAAGQTVGTVTVSVAMVLRRKTDMLTLGLSTEAKS